jgi:hypothetical protein
LLYFLRLLFYVVVFPLLLAIDVVHAVGRTLVLLFALAVWWGERRLAKLRGRSWFCPLCINPLKEPLVYCPDCLRIQPRLRPGFDSPLSWRCPCGRSRWSKLGRYFLNPPRNLGCRDTDHFEGCYHPHPLPHLAGRLRPRHVAIVGTSERAKHAVMAHLLHHCVAGERRYQLVWDLNQLELELCRQFLFRSMREDTRGCEQPGQYYRLARTFLLQRQDGNDALVFHNIPNELLENTESLADYRITWDEMGGLLLVIDDERTDDRFRPNVLSQAEIYSRLLRVIEEYRGTTIGERLPFKVAVLLPVAAGNAADFLPAAGGLIDSDGVKDLLKRRDPPLFGLLNWSTQAKKLRYFGGIMPDELDLKESQWIQEALDWIR